MCPRNRKQEEETREVRRQDLKPIRASPSPHPPLKQTTSLLTFADTELPWPEGAWSSVLCIHHGAGPSGSQGIRGNFALYRFQKVVLSFLMPVIPLTLTSFTIYIKVKRPLNNAISISGLVMAIAYSTAVFTEPGLFMPGVIPNISDMGIYQTNPPLPYIFH